MSALTGHDRPAAMRASDADRDAVISDLSEHFRAGRLTADEFDERTGRPLTSGHVRRPGAWRRRR